MPTKHIVADILIANTPWPTEKIVIVIKTKKITKKKERKKSARLCITHPHHPPASCKPEGEEGEKIAPSSRPERGSGTEETPKTVHRGQKKGGWGGCGGDSSC